MANETDPTSVSATHVRSPFVDGAEARRKVFAIDRERAVSSRTPSPRREKKEPDTGSMLHESREKTASSPIDTRWNRLLKRVNDLSVGTWFSHPESQRALRSWLMRYRSDVVDPFGFDPKYASGWEPLLRFLYRHYFRVDVSGIHHVPDFGKALLVANHAGILPYDGAMLMCALRYDHPAHRALRPLVADYFFHMPYLGMRLNRMGFVRACPENAEQLLMQNSAIAVFPEGVQGISKLFRDRYKLQRFGRGGFIKLALRTKAPIIPTAIIGSEETAPLLGKIPLPSDRTGLPFVPLTTTFPALGVAGLAPLPSKWHIQFGEPIEISTSNSDGELDPVQISRLNEQVRGTIQTMLQKLVELRGDRHR